MAPRHQQNKFTAERELVQDMFPICSKQRFEGVVICILLWGQVSFIHPDPGNRFKEEN